MSGLNLKEALPAAALSSVRKAWLDNLLLVFPGQDLTPPQLIAFSRQFGEVDDNRSMPDAVNPEYNEVTELNTAPVNGKPAQSLYNGRSWHSDLSYTVRPATASFLHCKALPEVGGDTMFANTYMAFDALSPATKEIVESLSAVHDRSNVLSFAKLNREQQAEKRRMSPPVVHPVVRVHPETGRKALYVSERVRCFVGMTEDESRPLIEFLNRHSVRYEFTYRHRWTAGDLLMWDNRCTMHLAVGDFDPVQTRHMIRTSLVGGEVGSVYAGGELAAAVPPAG